MFAAVPSAVEVNVPRTRSIASVVVTALPDEGRNGETKYAKSDAVTRSVYSPFAPLSRSNMETPTIDVDGSTNGVLP